MSLRRKDWPERLAEVLRVPPAPFAWGSSDCCFWTADVIRDALTGEDVVAAYRDTYEDKAGAVAILEQEGGIEALWMRLLGVLPYEHVLMAKSGDVGLVQDDGALGRCVGIVHGGHIMCLVPEGLKAVPAWPEDQPPRLLMAWPVGWP